MVNLVEEGLDVALRGAARWTTAATWSSSAWMWRARCLVASPDLLIRQGTPTTLEPGAHELYLHVGTRQQGRVAFAPQTVQQQCTAFLRATWPIIAHAQSLPLSGTGICWLPDYMCHDEIRDRRLVHPMLPDWAPAGHRARSLSFAPWVGTCRCGGTDFLGESMPGRSSMATRCVNRG